MRARKLQRHSLGIASAALASHAARLALLWVCACSGTITSEPSASGHASSERDGLPGNGNGHEGNGNGQGVPVDCDTVQTGVRRLWRLTPAQYDTSIRETLGVDGSWGAGFPADEVVLGFRNNADALRMTGLLADKVQAAAEDIAASVSFARFDGCANQSIDAACMRTLTERIGERLFRRPLTAADVDRYVALGDMHWVLTAMLQSPHFLYRSELGTREASGRYALGDFEIASELSFMLWNGPPDDALFEAARNSQLHEPGQIRVHVSRMLQSEKARAVVRGFVFEWLGLSAIATVPKDTMRYPELTPEVRAAMIEEAERFVDHVMFVGDGSITALLTEPTTFLDERLAAFYGTSAGDSSWPATDLSQQERAGILTLGGTMMLHARSNDSSPIHRGKLIREKLLCQELQPPPPGIVVQPPPLDPTKTSRERYAEHSSVEPCRSCHRLMDPIGLAFEHFDGAGRYRADDNGLPIDVRGEIELSPRSNGTFVGTAGLIDKLADSEDVRDCFALQWMRYAYGMGDEPRSRCVADRISAAWRASEGTLTAIVGILADAEQLRYRDGHEDDETQGPAPVSDAGSAEVDAANVADASAVDASVPTDDAAVPSKLQQTLINDNDYGSGYCHTYELINHGSSPLTWSVALTLDGMLSQSWESMVSGDRGTVTFTGVAHNATLMPGQSTQFGFCVTR